MKTLLILLSTLFIAFNPRYAQASPHYQVDLVDGRKNFVTEVTVATGMQVTLDLYLTDAGSPQHAGGAWLDWSSSTALLSYISAGRAFQDGSEGVTGPWTSGVGALVNEPDGPGTLLYMVANLGGAQPDADGDIIVGRVVLQCTGAGDAVITLVTVPGVSTWTPIRDADILPASCTVHQSSTAGSSTTSSLPGGTTSSSTDTSSSAPPSTSTTTIPSATTTTELVPVPTSTSSVSSTTTTTPTTLCPVELIYGEDSDEVQKLRSLRDTILHKTPEGQAITQLFYEWSDFIGEAMHQDEGFRQEVSELVYEVVKLVYSANSSRTTTIIPMNSSYRKD